MAVLAQAAENAGFARVAEDLAAIDAAQRVTFQYGECMNRSSTLALSMACAVAVVFIQSCNGGAELCRRAADCDPGEVCDSGTCLPCQSKSCQDLGKNCGTLDNGCGGTLDCGACASGVCGAMVANVCGVPACTPATCISLGATCGLAGDGCGGSLQCGTCSGAGETCGGGGLANACGTSVCVPKTCATAGANCGNLDNGCASTISCGACSVTGESCGAGGTANVCGLGAVCKDIGVCMAGQVCNFTTSRCQVTGPCDPSLGQPSNCGTAGVCTNGKCTQIAKPSCSNFKFGSAPLQYSPLTSTGPTIYAIAAAADQTEFCAPTEFAHTVTVSAYRLDSTWPANVTAVSDFSRYTESGDIVLGSGLMRPDGYVGAATKNANFTTTICSPSAASLTVAFAFDSGNGACGESGGGTAGTSR